MSKLKQKAFAIFMAMAFVLTMSGSPAAQAASLTQAQIDAIISLLQSFGANAATISSVNSALSGAPVVSAPAAGAYSFTKDLTVGSKSDEVMNLQKYLNSAGYAIAASGAGSSGNESTYFGSLTKSALAKWQAANGISPAVGYWGALSRAKYAALSGVSVPTTPTTPAVTPVPVSGAKLAVAAGTQPAASLFPLNSTRVPFTVVKLTAGSSDVTVNSLTVERTGLAVDAAFSGVVLLDENGTQVGIAKTLNSAHQVLLNEPFTVKAGQTRVMTLAGNGATSSNSRGGQIGYLSLVAIDASSEVTGALPIVGAGHTVNESLTIGSVTMARGSLDPGSSQSKEVGTTGYVFSGVKVTAGSSEDIYLRSVRWNQTGSAGSGDLANLKTYVEGTGSYDIVVSSDGKYYTATFGDNAGKGILIPKGFSKDIYIKGDVMGGSSRTVIFSVAKKTDVGVVGALYGYGITPPITADCSSDTTSVSCFRSVEDPWYRGSTVTVSSGSMTVSTSAAVPSQNIAINLAGQPLGAFDVDVKGEPISVAAMGFNFTIGSKSGNADATDFTNVSLYDENGKVVAGPIDGIAEASHAAGTAHGELYFTDTVVFPVGKHTYSLKGKVGTDITNGMTFQASTTPSSDFTTVRGQTTNNTITPAPTSVLSLSTMTVKSGAFTVSVSSDPIAQTIIAGNKGFTFAKYIFDVTGSGEDIRVTSIPLAYDFSNGASANELTSCKLFDGATALTTGSNVVNPTAAGSSTSFVFDGTGITLAKGTAKTLSLKCDLSGSATTSSQYYWGIDSGQNSSYTAASGLTSGQTIAETFNDSVGQRMTVATGGTLAVALDPSSPGYTIVAAGTTGATLSKIKFSATNEDIDLKQIALQLTGSTASSSRSDLVGSKVTIWDGTTQVGEAVFPTSVTATSTLSTTVRVPNGGAKVLTIKGDIQPIAFNGVINKSGDLLKVDYDGSNVGLNGTYGTGVSSGSTVNGGTSDTAASGVRIMRAYPSIAKLAVPNTTLLSGNTAGKTLYRFSVTANGGDVALYKMTFVIGSSSVQATTSTYGLYAYTDSGFASIDSAFASDGLVNYGNCVGGRSDVTNTSRTPGSNNSPLTIEVFPDKGTTACNATTTYTVPSGVTRYFDLRATVANVEAISGVSDSISAQLEGDAAYPATITAGDATGNMFNAGFVVATVATPNGVDTDSNDDFIWSPISTTTSVSQADLDWTNGYLVPGLPTTNTTIEYFTSTN